MTSLNVFNESFNPKLCRNQSRIDLHEFLEPTVAEAEQLPRSLVRLALRKITDYAAAGDVFVQDCLRLSNIIWSLDAAGAMKNSNSSETVSAQPLC